MYYTARQQHESLTPSPPPMRRARTRNSYSRVTIVCFSVVVMHSNGVASYERERERERERRGSQLLQRGSQLWE